jgi:hypothetical protein
VWWGGLTLEIEMEWRRKRRKTSFQVKRERKREYRRQEEEQGRSWCQKDWLHRTEKNLGKERG